MDRNLAIGDAGEALFRYWFETNCHGLDDLVLTQFGYNPEGIVADEDKKEMLKEHEDAPDFALFRQSEYEDHGIEADPLVGISITLMCSTLLMNRSVAICDGRCRVEFASLSS